MKKRVIICGYPKSGNTWLARLTAEILRCPVVGFWCDPFNNDEAIEGLDRESDFQCFKAHHTYEQMDYTLEIYGNGTEKFIYIHRDPRSIIVSASHYFGFTPKHPRLHGLLRTLPRGVGLYYNFFQPRSHKLDTMTRGLVEGIDQEPWLREPWEKHVRGWQNKKNVLVLSYERLKTNPLPATRQISRFLSIDRTDEELEAAILAQSFARKKNALLANGERNKANFMRRGQLDAWKDELPAENLRYIEQKLGDFMRKLGYKLSFDSERDTASGVPDAP